jgi:hypothetical protein
MKVLVQELLRTIEGGKPRQQIITKNTSSTPSVRPVSKKGSAPPREPLDLGIKTNSNASNTPSHDDARFTDV